MAETLDPREIISILELTVSHMWSIAALVESLERKGLLLQAKRSERPLRSVCRHTPKVEQAIRTEVERSRIDGEENNPEGAASTSELLTSREDARARLEDRIQKGRMSIQPGG